MLSLYDRTAMMQALTLELDAQLLDLLRRRIASLEDGPHDLLDWTEITVIEPGDSEDAVAREIGFSPLVEPIDGARFGTPGFAPFWDQLIDHQGWFEMVVSFGSTFASILFIPDAGQDGDELTALCRQHAIGVL